MMRGIVMLVEIFVMVALLSKKYWVICDIYHMKCGAFSQADKCIISKKYRVIGFDIAMPIAMAGRYNHHI